MNNNKAKGSRSERKVRDHYEQRGWLVMRAGGSLGMFDLVCLHPDKGVDLVQVKTNRTLPKQEREAIQAFQCHGSWRKIFCLVRDYRGIEFYDI